MSKLDKRVSEAVKHFWRTRKQQSKKQGSRTGRRDTGSRSAVTGGAQMDGFVSLVKEILIESGLPEASVHLRHTTLPGYFRPTKEWDLVVVVEEHLLATIEFKSQVGPSFGNNFNNRVEEALGSATDLWAAYREGAYTPSMRPWLGYLILLEEVSKSTSPVSIKEPHFNAMDAFHAASYAKRYELFCQRLTRERLYDSACFLLTDPKDGTRGKYRECNAELGFEQFAISLTSRAVAFAKTKC